MARPVSKDPLDKFRFIVDIEGFTHAGFSACTSPSFTITAKDYPEGGNHLQPKKIVDSISYKNVTLARGVTGDTSFNKWATGFIDLVQNEQGTKNAPFNFDTALAGASGEGIVSPTYKGGVLGTGLLKTTDTEFTYRRTVRIKHLNSQGSTICTYILYGAFPIEYTPASDFDASSDDGVSIETLVLAYDSFEVKFGGVASAVTGAITSFI
jgi:phage tail-like protein